MGNNLDGGFQRLPRVYLNDLRKKTEKRFRSITAEVKQHKSEKEKKQGNCNKELNAQTVTEYVISNPDFLDDLVKNYIAQDRVRAWIREPTDDDSELEDVDVEEERHSIKAPPTLPKLDSKKESSQKEDPKTRSSPKEDLETKPSQREDSKTGPSPKADSKGELSLKEETKGEPSGKEDSKQDLSKADDSKKMSLSTGRRKSRRKSRGSSTFAAYNSEKVSRQRKLLVVTRSRLSYPFKYSRNELSDLIEKTHADSFFGEIDSHLFPYTDINNEDINKAFIKMAGNLLGKHAFPMAELCYFLTTLRANYLDVEYHNYSHALSHAQSMYWILKRNPGVFTELEIKALLIASIAHDVGHPGLNETYLKNVHSGMQKIYEDPILENHHTQTCFLVLQEIKCNVFCNLGSDDYKQVLEDIRHSIISTNVNKYKMQCERVRQILETGIDMDKKHVRQSVKSLLMMACDLCSSWKRWDEHKNIVWSLYKEFFNQGDKEMQFDIDSPPQMLRMNADCIPKYQTGFLENVVIPIFQLLSKVFPNVENTVKSTQDNLDCWKTYG